MPASSCSLSSCSTSEGLQAPSWKVAEDGAASYAQRLVQAWREHRDAARARSSRALLLHQALRRIFTCWHVLAVRDGQRRAGAAEALARSALTRRALQVGCTGLACVLGWQAGGASVRAVAALLQPAPG